jgi:hypothetical protein
MKIKIVSIILLTFYVAAEAFAMVPIRRKRAKGVSGHTDRTLHNPSLFPLYPRLLFPYQKN